MQAQVPAICCWREARPLPGQGMPGNAPGDKPADTIKTSFDDTDRTPFLLCAACNARVTRQSWRRAVKGSDTHVFCNPAGLVFELGCFSAAPGALALGPVSTEFTWFAGCAWQIAVCRACTTHLGWRYASLAAVEQGFYGLILDALVEETITEG